MGITYHNIEQNTDEWFSLRTGIMTASQVKNILTPTLKVAKNEKTRALVYEMAAQRETGHYEEIPQSYHMERGHIEEDIARDIYSNNYKLATKGGFITNDDLGFTVGFSPDGLVGNDGFIEIKSVIQKNQVKTIVGGEVPSEHILQVQTGLLVSGRDWCDFISYSNGMPFFVRRVEPDLELHEKICEALQVFHVEVELMRKMYRANADGLIVAERKELIYCDEISSSEVE